MSASTRSTRRSPRRSRRRTKAGSSPRTRTAHRGVCPRRPQGLQEGDVRRGHRPRGLRAGRHLLPADGPGQHGGAGRLHRPVQGARRQGRDGALRGPSCGRAAAAVATQNLPRRTSPFNGASASAPPSRPGRQNPRLRGLNGPTPPHNSHTGHREDPRPRSPSPPSAPHPVCDATRTHLQRTRRRSYEAGSLELRKPGRPAGHNSALLKFSVFLFLAVRRFSPRNVLRLAAPRRKSAVTLRRRKISAGYFYFLSC